MKNITLSILLTITLISQCSSLLIPKLPGYTLSENNSSLQVEVFLDPHCQDSSNFWTNFQDVLNQNISQEKTILDLISLKLHMFGLPYHHNSYLACKMLNYFEAKSPNEYICFLDAMFTRRDYFNSGLTSHSIVFIQDKIISYGKGCLNKEDPNIESVYSNSDIDLKARYDYKYASKKGIFSYPTILVNGFEQDLSGMNTDQIYDFFKDLIKSNNESKKEFENGLDF